MTRTAKPSHKASHTKAQQRPAPEVPDADADTDAPAPSPIVERPDGFYWTGPEGGEEFGPFRTQELALAARDAVSDEDMAPGDALQEAEREIGIADWIDVETGEPAEGQSPPHLQEE